MIGVNRRLKEQKMKSRLVLQVHDELLIEAYKPEIEEIKNILKSEMEQAADLKVPLEVDMHTGTNWYEAK
jgi:DNA polymerase-1